MKLIFRQMKYFTPLIILLLAAFSVHAQMDQLTRSLNDYSFDLYGKVKSDNDNLFFSPLSTYYALLIACEGAGGETRQEFEKVLHIDNYEDLTGFTSFSENLTTQGDSSNYIRISNVIWAQKDFSIREDYKNNISKKYLSELKTVDFTRSINASEEINNWVANRTNGLIKNIISPVEIDSSIQLAILNAIYFIGKWEDEFNKNVTQPDNFYAINKKISRIDFMHKTESLYYFENNKFQFVSKPYKGNDKSFCIILPKERYGLADIETVFTNATLDDIFSNIKNYEVIVSIPKFKLETDYLLNGPLQELGLEKAFVPDANFTGITSEMPLWFNIIKHKACIEINEEKTEAAAATILGTVSCSIVKSKLKPKIFKADHPFAFIIIDNKTKGIIFIGRYVQP